MCGTLQTQGASGEANFSDIKIKRPGEHILRIELNNCSIDRSGDAFSVGSNPYKHMQKRLLGTKLLLQSENFFTRTRFSVRPGTPFYLINDYAPLLKYLTSNTTRAGLPFEPAPACMVTDFYGNPSPYGKFRVGLSIRDSDQDEFDPNLAMEKFNVSWPGDASEKDQYAIGEHVDLKFTKSEYEVQSTRDDKDGCPPLGQPAAGCPSLAMNDVFALIRRDEVVTPSWCPATNEKRHCRSCLTSERFFAPFNETFWKQEYEFVDSQDGTLQRRGAFDCPLRKHCRDGETGCGCLIHLYDSSERTTDLCSGCSSRSMEDGMPVAWSKDGRAEFPNIMCSKPRSGYRLRCIAPEGPEGDNLPNELRLNQVMWDYKPSRAPPVSFIQDSSWGRFTKQTSLKWRDESGNRHPNETHCEQKCQDPVTEVPACSQNATICFRYGFPAYYNPSFAYSRPESPSLSEAFKVRAGDVQNLHVTSPLPAHSIRAFDLFRVSDESSFMTSSPSFQMSDRYYNPNRTSVGRATVTLVATGDSLGSELSGELDTSPVDGVVTFKNLRIGCPGVDFKLKVTYRRWTYGPASSERHNVSALSLPFNVAPAPPRLEVVKVDNTWTKLLFVFDSQTNKGQMPVTSDCQSVISGVGVYKADNWTFIPFCALDSKAGCSYKPFGKNPPTCSWADDRTMQLNFGPNATLSFNDVVFLRNLSEGGAEIRSQMSISQKILSSPPVSSFGRKCVGARCGGLPVMSNDVLEEVPWACVEDSSTGRCDTAILGENIADAVYVHEQSASSSSQDSSKFMIVASRCSGEMTCEKYDVAKGVVIYEMLAYSPNLGFESPYLYRLVEKQSIQVTGAVDLEYFALRFDKTGPKRSFAVARYFDGTTHDLSVDIYGQSEGNFAKGNYELMQSIQTQGAVSIGHYDYGQNSFLLVAQESSGSLVWRWAPGYFSENENGEYTWNPGRFQLVFTIPGIGKTSKIRVFWIENDLMLGISHLQGDTPCSASACAGNGLTARSTIDVFKAGTKIEIAEFIPFPCDRYSASCVPISFCLSAQYANITIKDPSVDAAKYLVVGAFLEMNGEMMQIVDSSAAGSADDQLRSQEALNDPLSPVFLDMLTFQEKSTAIQQQLSPFLDMADPTRRNGENSNWFLLPRSYFKSWSDLGSNGRRLEKFLEYVEQILGTPKFLPVSPAIIDVNGDGVVDIVLGTRTGRLRVLYGSENQSLSGTTAFFEKNLSNDDGIGLAHINVTDGHGAPIFADIVGNDGLDDLILGDADGRLKVFQASRPKASSGSPNASTASSNGGDVPHDSNLSSSLLLVFGLNTSGADIKISNVDRIVYRELIGWSNPLSGIKVPGFSKPAVGDVDADGFSELVVGASDGLIRVFSNVTITKNGSNVSDWREIGVLNFTNSSNISQPITTSGFSSPTFVDLDADGVQDLVVGDFDGRLHVFKMDPTRGLLVPFLVQGSISVKETIFGMKSAGMRSSPAFHDIDGDNYTELLLGHSFGDVEIYRFRLSSGENCRPADDNCAAVLLQEYPVRLVGDGSPGTISLREYEAVFTGFRCMKPKCRNCTRPEQCQETPCYGVDTSTFVRTSRKSQECEDWVALEPSDGVSCCDYALDGRFKPCRRPGYITVQRAMQNTRALADGTCAGSVTEAVLSAKVISRAFSIFDSDSSGYLEIDEASDASVALFISEFQATSSFEVLKTLGLTVSEQLQVWQKIDADGDGRVSLLEFQDATPCNGRMSCQCTDGMNKGNPCLRQSQCLGHMPGSKLHIMQENVREQNPLPEFQLPVVGAKDFSVLTIDQEHYIAVSNHKSGCGSLSYEQDSALYRVNFRFKNYTLHQSFLTKGSMSLMPFYRDVDVDTNTRVRRLYMLVANYRDRYGLVTKSSLYQWTTEEVPSNMCTANASDNNCLSPSKRGHHASYFAKKLEFDTVGALSWIPIPQESYGPIFIQISSRHNQQSSTQSKAYRFAEHRPALHPKIEGYRVLSPCSALELHATSSTGNAARPFELIQWELIESPALSLDRWLPSMFASFNGSLYVRIERQTSMTRQQWKAFFPPGKYVVRLTLSNWAGRIASTDFYFTRLNNSSPSLDIVFVKDTIEVSEVLIVESRASLDSCDLEGSEDERSVWSLTYRWSMSVVGVSVGCPEVDLEGLGLSTSMTNLRIPAYTLAPGCRYNFELTASHYGLSSTASRAVQVRAAMVEARISGGQKTVFVDIQGSNLSNTTCGRGSGNLAIDAGKSRNLAFPESSSLASAGLHFSWTCSYRVTEKSVGLSPCAPDICSCCGTIGSAELGSSCEFFVSKLKPATRTSYFFEVTVRLRSHECVQAFSSNPVGAQACPLDLSSIGDVAATAIYVEPSPETPPIIHMKVESEHTQGTQKLADSGAMTAVHNLGTSTPLVLSAVIELQGNFKIDQLQWKLESGQVSTCESASDWCHPSNLMTTKKLIGPNTIADPTVSCKETCKCASTLSIAPCVFQGSGSLLFSLSASSVSSGFVASSSIWIQFNQPPTGGTLVVTPAEGYSLVTSFELTASGWFDPEKPLSVLRYSFSYREPSCMDALCEQQLVHFSSQNKFSITLPPGNITLILGIMDEDGVSCPVSTFATVSVLPFSVNNVTVFSANNMSMNATTNVKSGSSINSVACSDPGVNCSATCKLLGNMSHSLTRFICGNLNQLTEGSDPSRTLSTLGLYAANVQSSALSLSTDEEQKIRGEMIQVVAKTWEKITNPSPEMCIQTVQVTLSIAGSELQLDDNAIRTTSDILLEAGKSVLTFFKDRKSADTMLYLKQADQMATILSDGFGKIFTRTLRQKEASLLDVTVLKSKLLRFAFGSLEEQPETYNYRRSLAKTRSADEAAYSLLNSMLESLSLISALSVANSASGDRPSVESSSSFKLVTSVLEKLDLEDYTASLDLNSSNFGQGLAQETCWKKRKIAECCRKTGTCCIQEQCDSWLVSKNISFSSLDFTVLMPSKDANTRQWIQRLASGAYELEVGLIRGNVFQDIDTTRLLSDVYRFNMRAQHSSLEFRDFTSGSRLGEDKPKAVLRFPISQQKAEDLKKFDKTTPTQTGKAAACVAWNNETRTWDVSGISQQRWAMGTRKFCTNHAAGVQCMFFVECETTMVTYLLT